VMRQRVMQFAERAVRITEIQRADHPVKDCAILFGGDMVEGLFNFPTQAFEIDATLFEQYVTVSRLCVDVVRYALAHYEKVTVIPEWGNHGRIGNYRAILIHGDEIGRNGYASPGAIVQHMNRWRSGSLPFEFRDVYVGHYHTHAEWPMANGQGAVYQTGSTESDNRYAGIMLAASATPSQRLHFIDPVKGRVTAGYKVWLD
jgi:hypothetical protein